MPITDVLLLVRGKRKCLLSLLVLSFFTSCTDTATDSNRYTFIPNSYEDMSAYYENQADTTLFRLRSSHESGITFYNRVHETMDYNFWRFKFLYSGSGVGTGDFNKDGLLDLFFVSNAEANALYLNKGDLEFEDISTQAGIKDSTGVSYGVAIADFNEDGWLDIYISKGGGPQLPDSVRANKLFINNQDLTFTESAAAYGLAHTSNTTQASLIDYDSDGDQDVYLTTHWLKDRQVSSLKTLTQIEKGVNFSDIFFRKEQTGDYAEVTKRVGVDNNGMGWSATAADYNNDQLPDLYVANDFIMYNYFYTNTGKGTFRQDVFNALKKMTRFGMGCDAGDVNNDGWLDIVVAGIDMDNHLDQKSMLDFSDTKAPDARIAAGYGYQKERNTLQLNNQDGTYSEIGCFAGVTTTNWTWGILMEDLDNDGWDDVFAANGYYNPWYMDNRFTHYSKLRRAIKSNRPADFFATREAMYRDHHKDPNQVFKNNGDLSFTAKTMEWGLSIPTVSYSALVADLDNDGDMDIISSNTNHSPIFYENRARELNQHNFLKISFNGPSANQYGWGTKVHLYDEANELIKYKQQQPIRGFLSTSDHRVNFGLGQRTEIPKLVVTWPDGKQEVLEKVAVNKLLSVDYQHASTPTANQEDTKAATPIFVAQEEKLLNYQHRENPYDDFDRQFMLHYQQSKHGPAIAVADVDGDGLDDVYFGGAKNEAPTLLRQNSTGHFQRSTQAIQGAVAIQEDLGSLFFDVDQDGDLDLYQCVGGGTYNKDKSIYQDQLYLNDGKGNFVKSKQALPQIESSGSCVIAADYDADGDLDLFVGGRLTPSFYPLAPRSYLLQNNGGVFTDVTPTALQAPGMVTTALWTDFNNDSAIDLIIAGDWMPIRFFQNKGGELVEITEQTGLNNTEGWWNSITGADIDEDGDVDYILGNAGLNTYYKTSTTAPLKLIYGDLNEDEEFDLFPVYQQAGKQYPVFGYGAFQISFPEWKEDIEGFTPFAQMTAPEIQQQFFPDKGQELTAHTFANVILINEGEGGFRLKPLANKTQLAPINGILTGDFDGDGHIDILCHGNFYPAHYAYERQDAGTGLFLQGDGKGDFNILRGQESGFWSDLDARSLALIDRGERAPLIVATNNSAAARVFSIPQARKAFRFNTDDQYALLHLANGKTQKIENYLGSGYLSQSSRLQLIGTQVNAIEIWNKLGESRKADILAIGGLKNNN